MTIQALCFLVKARRVQRTKGLAVSIDDISRTMHTVALSGREVEKRVSKLKETSSELYPMLQYLQDKGYLVLHSRKTFHLTHSGFFYLQSLFSDICSFLFKSVIVPIVVSIITALITVWLNNPQAP